MSTLSLFGLDEIASADLIGGYVHKEPYALTYLRITQDGHSLSGFAQIVKADINAQSGSVATTVEFTGQANKGSFSIQGYSISQIFGNNIVSCSGTGSASSLKLTIPGANGYVGSETFQACSQTQWNKAVAAFAWDHQIGCLYVRFVQGLSERCKGLGEELTRVRATAKERDSKIADLNQKIPLARSEYRKHQELLEQCKKDLEDCRLKEREPEQVTRDAYTVANRDGSEESLKRVKQAEAEQHKAEQRQSDAESAVNGATGSESSARERVENLINELGTANGGIAFIDPIAQVHSHLEFLEGESSVLQASKALDSVSDLRKGLMRISAIPAGSPFYARPSVRSKVIGKASGSNRYPVLPMAQGWCYVMLSDKSICWVESKSLVSPTTLQVKTLTGKSWRN